MIIYHSIIRHYWLIALTLALSSSLWGGYVFASNAVWIDGSKARLQALDKITARISTVESFVGVSQFFGTLEVTVERCAFHPPEEPPENAAFMTVYDRGHDGLKPNLVFSGWVFSSSPAVSALEHPVYDITLLACIND